LTHTPALALATELASQTAGLTLGTNVFHSMMRGADGNIPTNAVFVWETVGPSPERTMGDPDEIRRALVNVQVRDSKYLTGYNLAYTIMNNLRGDDVATYLDLAIRSGSPSAMGQDSDGNHIFSMVYMMAYQEP